MECRKFEVTLVSAQNLENVRRIFKNRVRVYAKVSVGDDPRTEKTTPVDQVGQTNPVWSFNASYTIGKNVVNSQDIDLLIRLYCGRSSGDTEIGEVSVSLKDLFNQFSTLPEGEDTAKVSYPVKKGGKDSEGEVSFSYKFGDVFVYEPPSIDWGKRTKFSSKGGETDFPYDIFCPGPNFPTAIIDDVLLKPSKLPDILYMPWGETDFLVDVLCPGADIPVPVTEDSTASLQTNAPAGSHVPTDGRNLGADVTSFIERTISAEVSLSGDVPMATDAAFSAEKDAMSDLSWLEAEVEVDATDCGGMNVSNDISCIEGDAQMDAIFSGEMNITGDANFSGGVGVSCGISSLEADVNVNASFGGEGNATGDHVSCSDANVEANIATSNGEANVTGDHISCYTILRWILAVLR